MPNRTHLLSAVLVAATAATALAHEFWLAPSAFRPAVGDTIDVVLLVGESFAGERVSRDDLRIVRFVVVDASGAERKVTGEDKRDPAGRLTIEKDGTHVVVYRGKRRFIELEAEKFNAYLAAEGLDDVVKARRDAKQEDVPGREVYSRCAKSLLFAGKGSKDGHDRAMDLTLELVPETNPYLAAAGDEFPFVLRHEGRPLRNALVAAWPKAAPAASLRARTDAEGRVKLRLETAGEWLLSAVHMVPAPKDTGADWESLWASLTFELPAKARPAATKETAPAPTPAK